MTRWYEVGFLTPFCRNHAEVTGYDHEPWRFGSYYEGIIRKYLKLRYRLFVPILGVGRGAPDRHAGVRPLLLNYQSDYNTLSIDDEFMVGTELLAAPILRPAQSSRRVYLPEGTWYDFWTGKLIHSGDIQVEHRWKWFHCMCVAARSCRWVRSELCRREDGRAELHDLSRCTRAGAPVAV